MRRQIFAMAAAVVGAASASESLAGKDTLEYLEVGMCGSMVQFAVARDFGEDSCLAGIDPELFAAVRRRAEAVGRDICHGAGAKRRIDALGDDQLETDHAAWVVGSIMSFGLATVTVFPRQGAAEDQYFREAVLFARRDARRLEHRRPGILRLGLHSPAEIRDLFDDTVAYHREEHRAVSEEYGKVIEGIEEDWSVFHLGHDQESVIRMLEWEEGAHIALRREEWRTLRLLVRAPVACTEERERAGESARRTAPSAGAPESAGGNAADRSAGGAAPAR